MGKLKDFLAAEGDKLLAEADAEAAAQRQWVQSVTALFQTLEAWVRAADTSGIIRVEADTVLSRDGETRVPRLRIEAGVRRVLIHASSRGVALKYDLPDDGTSRRSDGLVEIEGGPHTYRLFLFRIDGQDRWYLRTTGSNLRRLDQEQFENLVALSLR
jgi:hypothetical protein